MFAIGVTQVDILVLVRLILHKLYLIVFHLLDLFLPHQQIAVFCQLVGVFHMTRYSLRRLNIHLQHLVGICSRFHTLPTDEFYPQRF